MRNKSEKKVSIPSLEEIQRERKRIRRGFYYRQSLRSTVSVLVVVAAVAVVIMNLVGMIPWAIACSVPLAMLGVGAEAVPHMVLVYLIPLCYLPTKRFFRAGQNRPSERT